MIGTKQLSRRGFLAASAGGLAVGAGLGAARAAPSGPAHIAITLDLEMSAQYPRAGMTEWNYQKGNLDEDTKRYAVEAARRVRNKGGVIHFFCVGRVLEQPDIEWLKEILSTGHPVGNHTYDHVFVKAGKAEEAQFRFQRSPWLVQGRSAEEVIRENITLCTRGLEQRAGFSPRGFRTPGGFNNGLDDRVDLQEMLLDLGFTWCSSSYPSHLNVKPDEQPGEEVFDSIVRTWEKAQPYVYPSGLIEVPMTPVSDVTAFRAAKWKLDAFLEATRRAVNTAIEQGAAYDFLAHPSCLLVEDPQFKIVELICDLANAAGDRAKIVDLDTIAARVKPEK